MPIDGPKEPVVTFPVTIDFRKLSRKEDKLSSSCLKLSKRGEAIQEKFKERVPRKVNVAAIQRYAHDVVMEIIYEAWVGGKIIDISRILDTDPIQEQISQLREWEKLVEQLPQHALEVQHCVDRDLLPMAIDLAKTVQSSIKNYAGDSKAGVRAMRAFYKRIDPEIRKALPSLPVAFGLNDFEDPGPDDLPFDSPFD